MKRKYLVLTAAIVTDDYGVVIQKHSIKLNSKGAFNVLRSWLRG